MNTQAAYVARFRCLYARMLKEHTELQIVGRGPVGLVQWMSTRKKGWSVATWRQYRSAVVFVLRLVAADEQASPIYRDEARAAASILARKPPTGCLRRTDKTSARKAKRTPPPELEKLLAYLDANPMKSRFAPLTASWLRTILVTGLRPAEWSRATLATDTDGVVWLCLHNAKAGGLRGNGDERRLRLPDSDDPGSVRDLVRCHLELLRAALAAGAPFSKVYTQVRDALLRANQRVFPGRAGKARRHITLYSARHQFVADAKASGLSRAEIAALMGHASDATAGLHYARRVSGRGGLAVQPDPASVVTVRQVHAPREPGTQMSPR